MNAAGFIIALVLGFIGGVAGALVTIEVKTDKIRKEIDDAVLDLGHVNSQLQALKDTDNAFTVALQRLIVSIKQDRASIWQSLNDLWNDYDERHPKQTKKDTEKPAKKERKKTKNEECS